MHILLVHQNFASLDEAGGTRHHEMARFLASRGHQVTILTSPVSYLTGARRENSRRWVERTEDSPGVTILRAYTYSGLHRSFVHRVISFLSFMLSSFLAGLTVREVDLVWGTSPPIFQGVTAWLLARLKGVPFLFEVRDLWPAFAVQVGVLRNPVLIRLSEWLERFLYRHADRLVVNSPGYIEHVTQRGARQVELVPNGADPDMFDPNCDGLEYRRQWGLDGKYVVLYAGAHGMSNDLGVVLDAARQLAARQDICFAFLGDGKEKPALIAEAQRLNLENVVFLPPVAKNAMSQALAAADACIAILKPIPLYQTTYPNKVFDYMAAGKPVILAIDGVIRQVVEQASAGIPVPPGDANALAQAAQKLADDPEAGRQMGLSGRKAIEIKFSRRILTEKFAALIEDMNLNKHQ